MSTGSLRLLAVALTMFGLLTLGASRSAEATSLFVDLVGQVYSVPDVLQSEFSVGDPLSLRFEIRLDADNAYADRWDYSVLPLGLANMELNVEAFSPRAVWGSLVVGKPFMLGQFAFFNWSTHARFGNQLIERLAWYIGRQVSERLTLGQVNLGAPSHKLNSVDPANLLSLLDLDLAGSRGMLEFYHRPYGERLGARHPLSFFVARSEITVPEPGTGLTLSLAALGLAGRWRQGRHRPKPQSR